MKNMWIALAVVALVCANVYAAPSNVVVVKNSATNVQQNSGAKKTSVVSKKKAKDAKAAAKAAQKEAAARVAKQAANKGNQKTAGKIQRAEKKYGTDTTESVETPMTRFDDMEAMILSTDAVENMKTTEEQTVQNVEENEVLSPSAPR